MNPHRAGRIADIAPFHVMDILARAHALERQGRDIIHLEIGEPDFATPAPIVAAGIAALAAGHTHYTGALGLPALREAIAQFHADRWGAAIDAARIVVTPGASGALLLALGLVAGPGDAVMLADPGYPCNRHFARFCEARAINVPVDATSGFQLTCDAIERHATPDLRAVLIASPSNPTGTVIGADELSRIRDWCVRSGVALIVDEIYLALTYDGTETTAARWDDVFVVNSFSKFFQMSGWRLGWLVTPEWALDGIERLAQNLFLAPSTPAQHAALAAFSPATMAILEARKLELRTRRDFLLPAIARLGIDVPAPPQGAFYLYADIARQHPDSFAFARELLEETGVAITPGVDFGSHAAQRFVRLAYTQPVARLAQAVERLADYLGR
jgi:aspartate/methionine/tyrosine aminotransferase